MTYPLYAVGLLIFIYWRSPDKDRRSLIDALTLTAGLALLSWTFLIRPYVHNPGLSVLQKSVAIAYPLGDVLTLALLAQAARAGIQGRTRCVQLLTLGAVGCLLSDVAFDWVQLHGTFHNGTIIDLGWALFYTAWGASALHPTMTRLTEPVPRQQEEVSPGRLAVLMLASLIAPVVLLTDGARRPDLGRERDRGVLRDPVPARAGPAVGRGRVAPSRAQPRARAAGGRPVPGDRGRPARRSPPP